MEDKDAPKEFDLDASRAWYSRERELYERLADSVRATLVSAITHTKIPFLDVTHRAKTLESFTEKIGRKSYRDPQAEMTDLSGIRVIAFIESDVDRICALIEKAFNVHKDKSLDKRKELGKDRFGYRSVHFVCDLGVSRLDLPENIPYAGRVFEVQVRTVLQHAWAEIEHDRGYKFSGVLPAEIERRLYAQSAILEAVDREFDRLAAELDNYAIEVKTKTAKGELDIEITTDSLAQYLEAIQSRYPEIKLRPISDSVASSRWLDEAIEDTRALGLTTIQKLDAYFTPELLGQISGVSGVYTPRGLVRLALIYADMDAFLNRRVPYWIWMSTDFMEPIFKKYGEDIVRQRFGNYGVLIADRPPKITASKKVSESKTSPEKQT